MPNSAVGRKRFHVIILVAILRVWWGTAPAANGIFERRIVLSVGGKKVCYYVVRRPEGYFVVAEADIIKSGAENAK